ncbi:MAG TPA: molybdopterin-dependent oxidoreductase, partial [Nocardioides sp.]
ADANAVFGGGGLTNEKAYQLGKFARVALGTSQIDYNGRWCMSSAASAGNQAFGVDRGLPFPLADIEKTDVCVLVGSNLAETMPPAARHLDRLRENGGKVVVIDPRLTPTGERADLFLQPVPGTDLPLALGVLHLLDAAGAVDEDYIAERTTGFEDVRRSVAAWWPEMVERVSGVEAAQLRELADLLAGAGKVMVLTARGAEQHAQGTATVLAWLNVALALGMPGKAYAGYGCLTGQGNGQGGREHGQKADQLPGYRMIDDPAARAHVAAVWGVDPETIPGKGRSAYELLDALGTPDGPKSLIVFGSNIVVSAPNATHITSRLADLDLLVVADMVMSETAALADVVLPVTQWAEETGTMTNLEGRVILRNQAISAPDGVKNDLDIITGLATRLGAASTWSTDPEEIFTELRAASKGGKADYSGITYDRIRDEDGVFWPCPEESEGTPRLFADSFFHADGRARFIDVAHRGPAEQPSADYPLHLTTGRVLAQYQSGAQTRRIKDLPDE